MEEQNITAVSALNFSATFDMVDHDILLQVLKNQYGIDGKALNWYDSYLHPRSCMVQVKGSTSTLQPLEFSVPQGIWWRSCSLLCICKYTQISGISTLKSKWVC